MFAGALKVKERGHVIRPTFHLVLVCEMYIVMLLRVVFCVIFLLACDPKMSNSKVQLC